jgi:hypothetical protein
LSIITSLLEILPEFAIKILFSSATILLYHPAFLLGITTSPLEILPEFAIKILFSSLN